MKIYIVSHYWDNGESYEDRVEFEGHKYYSALELATTAYYDEIYEEYIGCWKLTVVELDTQKTAELDKVPYKPCPSCWRSMESDYDPCSEADSDPEWYTEQCEAFREPDYDYYCDALMAWRYPTADLPTPEEEEDLIVQEWLHHEGENLKAYKEMEEARKQKELAALLAKLNTLLDSQL